MLARKPTSSLNLEKFVVRLLTKVDVAVILKKMFDKPYLTVGSLRQQSALDDTDDRVALILSPKLKELFGTGIEIELVRCWPDTTNEKGEWKSTFKIQAALKGEKLER